MLVRDMMSFLRPEMIFLLTVIDVRDPFEYNSKRSVARRHDIAIFTSFEIAVCKLLELADKPLYIPDKGLHFDRPNAFDMCLTSCEDFGFKIFLQFGDNKTEYTINTEYVIGLMGGKLSLFSIDSTFLDSFSALTELQRFEGISWIGFFDFKDEIMLVLQRVTHDIKRFQGLFDQNNKLDLTHFDPEIHLETIALPNNVKKVLIMCCAFNKGSQIQQFRQKIKQRLIKAILPDNVYGALANFSIDDWDK